MTYAGDVTPIEAFAALEADPGAVLVDVRTSAEWQYVGVPDLSTVGRQVIGVEWQRYPDGSVNPEFVDDLQSAVGESHGPIYFLCRSGVRSVAAAHAATRAGLGPAYNVLDGFEGSVGPEGHRSLRGWKIEGLPWRQG
jgi:rhodanese-related sulfurtransferase